MKPLFILLVMLAVAAGMVYIGLSPRHHGASGTAATPAVVDRTPVLGGAVVDEALPERAVLDISVHTLDELHVLLDRAERLSSRLLDSSAGGASVVLVLHGPEVEFFARKNYERYKDIVDQAARLDAFGIVDVKICQTMMSIRGVAREDIPVFIDQVPDGRAEVERLRKDGYVYF